MILIINFIGCNAFFNIISFSCRHQTEEAISGVVVDSIKTSNNDAYGMATKQTGEQDSVYETIDSLSDITPSANQEVMDNDEVPPLPPPNKTFTPLPTEKDEV